MPAAGGTFSVLVRSDGTAVHFGDERYDRNIPALPEGITYTQAAAGSSHMVLLKSDGTATAHGCNSSWQCELEPLSDGVMHTAVAAGFHHTVVLKSDGTAEACGCDQFGQCSIPALEAGVRYTQVAAGTSFTVLLKSDGTAVGCGDNQFGQCNFPPLPAGVTYTQVAAAGHGHTVLLRSDGKAVAVGAFPIAVEVDGGFPISEAGSCFWFISPLSEGLTYTHVSSGPTHIVLLKSDGTAEAYGINQKGECEIPALSDGVTYIAAAAGESHTVLVKSDGTAVAFGNQRSGQCDVPPLPEGVRYLGFPEPQRLLSVTFCDHCAIFTLISGTEMLRVDITAADTYTDIRLKYERVIAGARGQYCVVLPDGTLFYDRCIQTPEASIVNWMPSPSEAASATVAAANRSARIG